MTREERFIDVLKKRIGDKVQSPVIQATVTEVGESSCTVKLTSNDLELPDVQYSATDENTKGFILVPKKDTNVLVGLIGDNLSSLYLVRIDDVEKVIVKIGSLSIEVTEDGAMLDLGNGTSLELTEDGIVGNGGNNGGLIIIQEIITKLNNLENGFNSLVSNYNAHIHITTATVGTGGPGTIAPTTSLETTVLTPTQKADLENDKFKH